MKKWILFIVLPFCISCSFRSKLTTEERQDAIDSLWTQLIQVDGCLVGGQYERSRFANMEHCIIHGHPEWKKFFKYPSQELTLYLVDRLDKTNETFTHTCPFYNATEGELAIYALQMIHRQNWFDLPGFTQYRDYTGDPDIAPHLDNHQSWLQSILTDPVKCKQMKQVWLNKI